MAYLQDLSFHLECRDGVTRVAVGGEIDIATAPALSDSLVRAEHPRDCVIMVDLRNVTFMDAMGLTTLLRARDRAIMNGQRLVIVGASRAVRRLFEATETQYLIEDEETVSVLDQFMGAAARGGVNGRRRQSPDGARPSLIA